MDVPGTLEILEEEIWSREFTIEVLEKHGFDYTTRGRRLQVEWVDSFLSDLGDKPEYTATEVMTWLGY